MIPTAPIPAATSPPAPLSHRGRLRAVGLTLVEVLVALAVLAVVTASLVALQVGSLRASRTARQTRELAAAAQHQLVLARLVPTAAGCHDLATWPTVAACQLTVTCLDASCGLRSLNVQVSSISGREQRWLTVANDALEAAPKQDSAGLVALHHSGAVR